MLVFSCQTRLIFNCVKTHSNCFSVLLPHSAPSWILSYAENLVSLSLQDGATTWHCSWPKTTHPPATHPQDIFFWLLHNLGSWNLACNLSSQKEMIQDVWDTYPGNIFPGDICQDIFWKHFVDTTLHLSQKLLHTKFHWPQKNVGTGNNFRNQNFLERIFFV